MAKITMKYILALTIFLIVSCVEPAEFKVIKIDRVKAKKLVEKKSCDIQVSFGSHASGTPTNVKQLINHYLGKNNQKFSQSFLWYWGKEGESSYCLILKDQKNLKKVFNDLQAYIPKYSKKGYTSLKTNTGLEFKTTWPKN